jgi:hypothetical protein
MSGRVKLEKLVKVWAVRPSSSNFGADGIFTKKNEAVAYARELATKKGVQYKVEHKSFYVSPDFDGSAVDLRIW